MAPASRRRQRKQGIGLVAMRERAEFLGGSLEFARPAEGGTLIRLTVPRENLGEKLDRMADKISVLLVDDHSLVRRGFRRILEDEPDITVTGEASDGTEAVRLAGELQPQVVVMDCAMPNMNGLEATRKILKKQPKTLVLMLSMHPEETLVRQALDAGARGYVLKMPSTWNWARRSASGGGRNGARFAASSAGRAQG